MSGPFAPKPLGPRPLGQPPLGGVHVGNGVGYPDSEGWIHPTPGQAVEENQRRESDQSRGGSGGCPQDPCQVPGR